jgi:hypothetical protein
MKLLETSETKNGLCVKGKINELKKKKRKKKNIRLL